MHCTCHNQNQKWPISHLALLPFVAICYRLTNSDDVVPKFKALLMLQMEMEKINSQHNHLRMRKHRFLLTQLILFPVMTLNKFPPVKIDPILQILLDLEQYLCFRY